MRSLLQLHSKLTSSFLKLQIDLLQLLFLVILAGSIALPLFVIPGHGVTFDGPTHITNMALIHRGLSEGEVRVMWGDGFANYGLPMPLIVQQFTSYLGAFLTFATSDVVMSYNLVTLIGAIFSTLFFYLFLRLYTTAAPSLLGAALFNFAPYRLVNIYTRGALPEFFASIWIPLILISVVKFIRTQKPIWFVILSISVGSLVLTHPFLVVIAMFIIAPFILIESLSHKRVLVNLSLLFLSILLGVGLAGYYLLPLFGEMKYFHYGQQASAFKENQFLPLAQLLNYQWDYFSHLATRGYTISPGVPELLVIGFAALTGTRLFFKHPKTFFFKLVHTSKGRLVTLSVMLIPLIIFLTHQSSNYLYQNISLLAGIQYPWRMYSLFIFLPPIILALLYQRTNPKLTVLAYILVLMILVIRIPQIYTKNNLIFDQTHYYQSVHNLHGTFLNTVWTEASENYPVQKQKIGIIEGEGEITSIVTGNSFRRYQISANTPMRLVDYTFFFPGWKVYSNGQEVPIEFQDISYRGVITYRIPPGDQTIELKFTHTRMRKFGYLVTASSAFLVACTYIIITVLNRKPRP